MRTTRRHHRQLMLVVFLSFIIKLVLLVPAHATYPVRDAWDYHRTGHFLHKQGEYLTGRAPLYPLTTFLGIRLAALMDPASISSLGGPVTPPPDHPRPWPSDLDLIRLIQVVMSTVSVWLMFLLGRRLFDARVGVLAAAIFAFYPEFVGYSHLLWAETQFLMLVLAWAVLQFKALSEDRASLSLAAGTMLGLAILTRQVLLTALPVLVAWVVLFGSNDSKRGLRHAMAVVLAAVLVVAPWTVRNTVVHDAFVPVSPQSGLALLWGSSPNLLADLKRADAHGLLPPIERDRRARTRALEIIEEDPGGYVKRMLQVNLPELWEPGSLVLEHVSVDSYGYGSPGPWLGRLIIALFVFAEIGVVCTAILGAALAPGWRWTLLLLGLVAHLTAVHTVMSGYHRQRLYVMCLAVPYTAFFLACGRERLRELASRPRVAIAAIGIAAYVLLLGMVDYQPLIGFWRSF